MFDVNRLNLMDTILISIFSMLVVFAVLLAISYMVDITALLVNRKSKKKDKIEPGSGSGFSVESVKKENKAVVASPLSQTSRRADSRTLAIIMAAIKAYEQDGQTLSVRKIVRSGQVLSGWEQASIQGTLRRSP